MAAAASSDTETTATDAPAEAPAKPAITAPSLVVDESGRHGLVVDTDEDGFPVVSWLGPASSYQLDVTKVG